MAKVFRRLVSSFAALVLLSGVAFAQSKVTIAVGGAACLCYLPTVLAKQLGEYERAGVNVEMVDFQGRLASAHGRARRQR
jgi:NitT/TauT family transport system substrate-binding protein